MVKKEKMSTGRIPLRFAAAVSEAAREAFEDGSMRAKVSPVTQELFKFWFDEPFTAREKNFLFVAPGLIVYERLIDAFCGKRTDIDSNWDFQTSDIFAAQELFVHPAFAAFYQKYIEDGLVGTQEGEDHSGGGTDDLVEATLKDGFEKYDLIWPVVIRECEDVFADENWMDRKLKPFTHFPLEQLKKVFAKDGERFISQEMLVGTRFGEYSVSGSIFNATSYNEYLQKIIGAISHRFMRINGRQTKWRPALQVNLAQVAAVVDNYIRCDLFGEVFDPFNGSDWKVLTCMNGIVTRHIVEQIGELVQEMEERTETQIAEVRKIPFSSVNNIRFGGQTPILMVKNSRFREFLRIN